MSRIAAAVLLFAFWAGAAATQERASPLTIGQTTFEEAVQAWSGDGTAVIQHGHRAVGAGSGVDGRGSYAVSEVRLVDVSGVDFEGLKKVRYGFVDGVLYSVTARLHSMHKEEQATSNGLSDAEVQALERDLRARYGPPTRSLKDLFADKKPNVLIWDLRDRELSLHIRALFGSTLQLRSKALAKKAEAYAKAECRRHRPQCAM